MDDNPFALVFVIGLGAYVAWLWWGDMVALRAGKQAAGNGWPGATPSSVRACVWAVAGALVILAAETLGEIALGLSAEQSRMTYLFAIYTLVAAVIEEIVFRGYVIVLDGSRARRALVVVGASLLFAAIHPFLWTWDDAGFAFRFDAKGWFSFGAVFIASLWFYTCRLASWNPTQSLLPCIAAHLAKNLGVIVIKGAQGFLGDWW
jgi:membrane protease YdiL (CAAX protease family)